MYKHNLGWSGSDLAPLAYESQLNSILRLAWRNTLPRSSLHRGLCVHKTLFKVDEALLYEKTGWHMDESLGGMFDVEYKGQHAMWRLPLFRYCPVCLECCYHSDLFQLKPVQACPLHHVQLTTECQCCGGMTASYGWSKAMIARPYHCHHCNGYLAGAEPSVEAYLDLREHEDALRLALDSYARWWTEGRPSRERLHQLSDDHFDGLQSVWCDVNDFLRAVACRGRVQPRYIRSTHYDNDSIVVQGWRCRINHLNPANWYVTNRTWEQRTRAPMAVYRCVLRMLARWIARRKGWTNLFAFDDLYIEAGRDVSGMATELIALLCMRWQVERGYSLYSLIKSWPIERAELLDEPSVEMEEFHHRTPRLGWRAVFLALYSAWYARVAGCRMPIGDATQLKLSTLEVRDIIFCRNGILCKAYGEWVPGTLPEPDEAWFVGEVAFMAVPDMPRTGAEVRQRRLVELNVQIGAGSSFIDSVSS